MYRLACLIISLLFANVASATYTNISPPIGHANIGGSSTFYSPRAVATYPGGVIANAAMNVGGKSVAVRTALPFMPGAAATAARAMFLNPALGAVAVAAVWASENCVGVVDGEWRITCGPGTGVESDGFKYRTRDYTQEFFDTPNASCENFVAVYRASNSADTYTLEGVNQNSSSQYYCDVKGVRVSDGVVSHESVYLISQTSNCPAGYYVGPAGCTAESQTLPIDEAGFITRLAPLEMPSALPMAVPANYPVGLPVINAASDNETAQKLIIPTGSPTVVPGSNPVSYIQPSTEVTPANSTSNPWQVDVKPISVPVSTPTGNTTPQSIPTTSSGGAAADNPDFCQKHPQSHVCTEMGNVDPTEIPNEDRNLQITPDSGWNFAAASCPAPRSDVVDGIDLEFSYQPICDFATGIQPVVVAVAWIIAISIFFGIGRKEAA